jgi:hypothetical protein
MASVHANGMTFGPQAVSTMLAAIIRENTTNKRLDIFFLLEMVG